MQKIIEKLKKDKSLTNQKAFLQALSKQVIYLAEIPLNIPNAPKHQQFFIEQDENGIAYLLGFNNAQYFHNWQQNNPLQADKISIKPFNFEELSLLMKDLQEDETALILNPASDNLILANELFHDLNTDTAYISDAISDTQTYVAMTPLEQGDFSFELLQLLQNEFNKENWISSVWAATIDINSVESFLLIIASNNIHHNVDLSECDQNLYRHLLDICKPFLGKAGLKILSSTTHPFNQTILNYDPIFARKLG